MKHSQQNYDPLDVALKQIGQPEPAPKTHADIVNAVRERTVLENRARMFEAAVRDPQSVAPDKLPESLLVPIAIYHALAKKIKEDPQLPFQAATEALITSMSEEILAGANFTLTAAAAKPVSQDSAAPAPDASQAT